MPPCSRPESGSSFDLSRLSKSAALRSPVTPPAKNGGVLLVGSRGPETSEQPRAELPRRTANVHRGPAAATPCSWFGIRERRLWCMLRAPCLSEMAQGSGYPGEQYFPTPLGMADAAGVRSARSSATTGPTVTGPSAHTYAAAEVWPWLVAELRASNHGRLHMFTRKLAPDGLGPVLAIADTLIFILLLHRL
ncbi:uncharacterized protein C2845_PM15G20500 [Panicum miliaceum]|uniref:Uncharacterized protein n=1 Tax=Panicum miliaceum TaxID=4540 RepID=A0A3L6Q9V9_PANMI|nr:uncharacterized protein C2845_PM15G20500 [Panicum miliaceum]